MWEHQVLWFQCRINQRTCGGLTVMLFCIGLGGRPSQESAEPDSCTYLKPCKNLAVWMRTWVRIGSWLSGVQVLRWPSVIA